MYSGKKYTNYNKYGIHIQNMPMFFFEKEDIEFDTRMGAIRAFTSCNPFLHLKYKKMGFYFTRESHDKCRICFDEDFIEFSRFSDLLNSNQILKLLFFKFELLCHNLRKGDCHFKSLYFFKFFGDTLETSYVDDSGGTGKVLHSYIRKGETVTDYTSNLVILWEDYESLLHPIVLNQISREEFFLDIKSSIATLPINLKFYCLFRDELLNGHTFLGGETWEVTDKVKQKAYL